MTFSTGDSQPWYEVAFGADYVDRYAHRDEEEARAAAELLRRHAPLPPAATVLDLCCGAGRHLTALDGPDRFVTGGDLSAPLLREAAKTGHPVVRLDMRHLPYRSQSCNLVANFFTAFGYFHRDEENFGVLEEVHRILRPGGWFLLDFLNAKTATRSIEKAGPEEMQDPDGTLWKTTRQMTEGGKRGEKELQKIQGDRVVETIRESVRFFTKHELTTALNGRGLCPQHVWGNYDGSPFNEETSPRTIILSQKRTP